MSIDSPPSTLCIVGLGMIGGSFAAALKKAGFSGEIVALVRSESTGARGLALGIVDRFSTDPKEVIAKADIVMLAVPMLSMREQLSAIADFLDPDAIVTDAGSVKGPFIDDARAVFGSLARVVPGHPIAGREKTGVDAADASLFEDKRVLLTPLDETEQDAINTVASLWELTGAVVESLSPSQHDRVLAATSHLPHVLAFALVDTLAKQQEAEEIFRYAAGGFRDFSRIASSDAVMWRDVCLSNRDAILESMDKLDDHLKQLRVAIESSDGAAIETIFARAKQARDNYT
ncbi:MAG: prephenate dehydrogenase [Granulosicoccus sp.]